MDFTEYVSVSQVAYLNNSGLSFYTKEHSDRGKMIHSLCHSGIELLEAEKEHSYLQCSGRSDDSDIKIKKEESLSWADTCKMFGYEGYLDSYLKLLEEYSFSSLITEKRLYDPANLLVGKPDFIGRMNPGADNKLAFMRDGIGIVDFKTSVNAQRDTWTTQLAGYWMLCVANGVAPAWAATIRIRKDGRKPIINCYLSKNEESVLGDEIMKFKSKMIECRAEKGD